MSGSGAPLAPISNPSENEGAIVLGVTLSVTILALLTFGLRAYVRAFMVRNFGWDDILMALAMAMSIAGQCVIVPEVYFGAWRHLGDIPQGDVMTGLKLNFITQPIYQLNICIVKLAVGAALHRIASTRFYKQANLGVMGFMAFYTIGCLFGDWPWDSRNITIWTVVENNIAIVAGSFPCLRPLLKDNFLSSSYGKGSSKTTKIGLGYPNAIGTMTRVSWQTLSKGQRNGSTIPDETSSERAFNAEREVFELSERRTRKTSAGHKGTFFTEVEAKSSDESLDRTMDQHLGGGMRKTTSVAMQSSNA